MLKYIITVSDYTREAGVRTLERRIAAVCRAVAVRVTEYNARKRSPPGGEMGSEKKTATLGDNKDTVEVVDVVDASAMSLPPEMPIVIDEHAIEDILGVSCCHTIDSLVPRAWANPHWLRQGIL